jgi:hypothetical protein
MKTIHRVKRKNHYTPIPNGLTRDRRISYQARAILVMMLSMPEDWVTYVDVILEFGSDSKGKDGEVSVRKALKELIDVGYLERTRTRGEKGRYEAVVWIWKDEPESGYPRSGFPRRGDPHTKKDRSKKESSVENSRCEQKKEKGGFVPKRTEFLRDKNFKPLFPYPRSEEEMVHEIEIRGFEPNLDYDGNFFSEFSQRDWRMPSGDKVWDWFELYQSRVLKTTGEGLYATEEGGF